MLRHLVSYIAFAQNQVLGLSKPTVGDGIVRKQQGSSLLQVFTDSDWAGCRLSPYKAQCVSLCDRMGQYGPALEFPRPKEHLAKQCGK